MAKSINDLSEFKYKKLELQMHKLLCMANKGLFTLAETYDVDKNEMYNWWLLLCENYSARDLESKKGLSVEDGMRMLKQLLDQGKQRRDNNGRQL